MGAVLAKFRKEKTTTEVLEKLEEDIKEIEEYSISTQARQKRYVGNFLVISIGFYVICFIVFYFVFFPPTWMERVSYSVPLLIFPLFIFFLKRGVAWYFQRKLNKNTTKLNKLKSEKKKTLEKVMDKETYKVAIEILNRFGGDKTTAPKLSGINVRLPNTPVRQSPVTPVPKQQQLVTAYPAQTSQNLINRSAALVRSADIDLRNQLTPIKSASIVNTPNTSVHTPHIQRTPYPIINQNNKGVLEKMVDYLIGDGPQYRLAMICKECYGHNGMALQEEYEYAAFRCVYCNAMNPSRKLRPIAPKLPTATPTNTKLSSIDMIRKSSDSSTSTSEKYSGSDSEDSENLQNKITPAANEILEKNCEIESSLETNLSDINNTTTDIADQNITDSINTDILNTKIIELKTPEKPIDEKKND